MRELKGSATMIMRLIAVVALAGTTAACTEVGPEKFGDTLQDNASLETMKAGIWVDNDGCDHWIIDDGVEGYLSARLDEQGRPVCSGVGAPNTVTGPFQAGQGIADIL